MLPGILALFALSAVYIAYGTTTLVAAVFAGITPAVLSIVAQAVVRVGRRALGRPALVAIAVSAFAALALFAVPFPLVVLGGRRAGWLVGRYRPGSMTPDVTDDEGPAPLVADDALHDERPARRRTGLVLLVGLLVWWVPVALVVAWTGRDNTPVDAGCLLLRRGAGDLRRGLRGVVVRRATGGGDLRLAGAGRDGAGLGLAETTPGPLIMVVQFVAFLGAYRNPGDLDPWLAATVGALLTTWVTFVPAFLLVFLGAPYVERLRHNRTVADALSGVTAAVVGVIANLALYFALHTLFDEVEQKSGGRCRSQCRTSRRCGRSRW